MAYNSKNFSALSYANGFTLWHYKTEDDYPADKSYFSGAASLVRKNDFIFCNWLKDDAIPCSSMEVVAKNDGREVWTADITG